MYLGYREVVQGEVKLYTVDLSEWLLADEAADSVVATVEPTTSPALAVTAMVVDSETISVLVEDGDIDTVYGVTLAITTAITPSGTRTRKDCLEIEIQEDCLS